MLTRFDPFPVFKKQGFDNGSDDISEDNDDNVDDHGLCLLQEDLEKFESFCEDIRDDQIFFGEVHKRLEYPKLFSIIFLRSLEGTSAVRIGSKAVLPLM